MKHFIHTLVGDEELHKADPFMRMLQFSGNTINYVVVPRTSDKLPYEFTIPAGTQFQGFVIQGKKLYMNLIKVSN